MNNFRENYPASCNSAYISLIIQFLQKVYFFFYFLYQHYSASEEFYFWDMEMRYKISHLWWSSGSSYSKSLLLFNCPWAAWTSWWSEYMSQWTCFSFTRVNITTGSFCKATVTEWICKQIISQAEKNWAEKQWKSPWNKFVQWIWKGI